MITKFKIKDEVNWQDYQCTFKIKAIVLDIDGSLKYRLSVKGPLPKNLKWVYLIVRASLAHERELIHCHQYLEKIRNKKLTQLFK